MKTESTSYLALLERRLELLCALASTLADSRNDFISMDLAAIDKHIARQEQYCTQIRSLDAEITRLQARCAERAAISTQSHPVVHPKGMLRPDSSSGDAHLDERISVTINRITEAQVELKRLNDAHQAMLRKFRHTIGILLNVFHSHAPTYGVAGPAAQVAGGMCEERA